MKSLLCICVLTLVGVAANADGLSLGRFSRIDNKNKSGQFGLGLAIGSYSGLSGQFWLGDIRTLNATVATNRGNFVLSVSHNWMFPGSFSGRAANEFVPYIGVGAIAAINNQDRPQEDFFTRNQSEERFALAAQLPLGIEFLPAEERFDIFAEIAPSLEVSPVATGFISADIGARFYF